VPVGGIGTTRPWWLARQGESQAVGSHRAAEAEQPWSPPGWSWPGSGRTNERELLSWDEFGHRLGGNHVIMTLVEHALRTPAAGPGTPPC